MAEAESTKAALRALIRDTLASVNLDQLRAWSVAIDRQFESLRPLREARAVLMFADVAAWKEPPMDALARRLLARGVRIASPRMGIRGGSVKSDPRVEACWISDWDGDFASAKRAGGTIEVRSPRDELPIADAAAIDVALVPGLAFDPRGGRLGRGGGWYDRFLPRMRADAVKVGVAWEVQIVPEMPLEGHDVRMNWVVTEGRVMDAARAG